MNTNMLTIRNQLKGKKPTFIRQDAHKIASLALKWRAPKGQHSKMRKKLKGYRRQPSIGWSSPHEVRGLTPDGHQVILVCNERELLSAKVPVTIAGTVGMHKRLLLLRKAKELKLRVLNVKDIDAYISHAEETLKARKEAKKKAAERQKATEPAKKKSAEAPTSETPEEKERREKEEKRKVLEQR